MFQKVDEPSQIMDDSYRAANEKFKIGASSHLPHYSFRCGLTGSASRELQVEEVQ